MTWLSAIIMGLVQGIAEFPLPGGPQYVISQWNSTRLTTDSRYS